MKRILSFIAVTLSCALLAGPGQMMLLTVKTPAPAVSVPTPDVLHWPLNDSAGATIVASVGPGTTANTGTLNGDYLAMASGNANYQSDSAVTWGASVVTVSFWINIPSWATSGAIIRSCYVATNPRFEIMFDGGWFRAGIWGTSGAQWARSYSPFATSTWTHIAVVLDNSITAGDSKLYINGSLYAWEESSTDKSTTGNFATDQLSIKSIFSDASVFSLDDLRVYGSELSAGQIAAIHTAGRP